MRPRAVRRCASTSRVPLSQFVRDSLYHPQRGFFVHRAHVQLARIPAAIDFHKLMGLGEYSRKLAEVYPPDGFLTPSELFRPFYGMSVARFYLRWAAAGRGRVVEAGPGLAGQANSFLHLLKSFYPEEYRRVDYTLVDVSPTLLAAARDRLQEGHGGLIAAGRLRFCAMDLLDFLQQNASAERCLLLLFEVLDNMPHDRVVYHGEYAHPRMTLLEHDEDYRVLSESLQPLQPEGDLARLFALWEEFDRGEKPPADDLGLIHAVREGLRDASFTLRRLLRSTPTAVHLPSHLFACLEALRGWPGADLLLSDFSWFPLDRRLRGGVFELNPPFISTQQDGGHRDFASLAEPPFGTADIFFASNFPFLQHLLRRTLGREAVVNSPKEFFGRFAERDWCRTRTGFSPLLEDFINTKYLFTGLGDL